MKRPSVRANQSAQHVILIVAIFALMCNTSSWSANLNSTDIRGVNLALISPNAPPEWNFQNQMEANRQRILNVKLNGFNAIRLKTFPSTWTSNDGRDLERTSRLLDDFLETARANGLITVITLFADFGQGAQEILCSVGLQQRLMSAITSILARYKDDPMIGIDILNEPPLTCPTDETKVWDPIQFEIYKAIRKTHKHVIIFLSGGSYGAIEGLSHIDASSYQQDHQVFFSFHFYRPFIYTHQGAKWLDPPFYKYVVDLPWPYAEAQADLAELEAQHNLANDTNVTIENKTKLHTAMQAAFADYPRTGSARYTSDEFDLVLAWMTTHSISPSQVIISEFGMNRIDSNQRRPPRMGSGRWMTNVRSNIRRIGINWMVWDFDGGQSVLCGQPPGTICSEYVDALRQ